VWAPEYAALSAFQFHFVEINVSPKPRLARTLTAIDFNAFRLGNASHFCPDAKPAHPRSIVVSGRVAELETIVLNFDVHAIAVVADGKSFYNFYRTLVLADQFHRGKNANANIVRVCLQTIVNHLTDCAAIVVTRRSKRQ
jgi:hypothetical protein